MFATKNRKIIDGRQTKIKIVSMIFLFAMFSFSFLFSSLTRSSYSDVISEQISEVAANHSTTKTFNLDIKYDKESSNRTEVMSVINTVRSINMNKTSFDSYNFRVVYSSELDTYCTFDFNNDLKYSMLPHTTSSLHKNELGENVFEWYEVKMLLDKSPIYLWNNCNTICELRETTAKNIIQYMGLEYSRDLCIEMINSGWFVDINYYNKGNNLIKLQITNVILEGEGYDEHLTKLFGDYILFYFYGLPEYGNYSVNFDFGTSYSETKSYLDFIKENYSMDDYTPVVNSANLIQSGQTDKIIESIDSYFSGTFYYLFAEDIYFYIIYLILALIILLIVVFLNFFYYKFLDFRYLSKILLLSFTCSYGLFFMFSFSNIIFFRRCFSIAGILENLIILLVSILAIFILKNKDNKMFFGYKTPRKAPIISEVNVDI